MIKHRTSLIVVIFFLLGTGCTSATVNDPPPSDLAPAPTDAADEAGVDELELPPGVEPLPEPNPIHLDIVLEEGNTAEAEIGLEGGTLEVTAADGTRFTLEIPAEALFSPELIRMTPSVIVEGLPIDGGALASVNLEPEGLYFFSPVTLFIQLPEGVSVENTAAFGTLESGQDFHLYPSSRVENVLEIHLSHFSGIGVVKAGPDDYDFFTSEELGYTPSEAEAYVQNATTIILNNVQDPEARADAIESLAKRWFYGSVWTRLKNAAINRGRLSLALAEYQAYENYLQENLSEEDYESRLLVEQDLALDAIATALKAAIEKAHRRCLDQKDPTEAILMVSRFFLGDWFEVWGHKGLERGEAEKLVSECFRFEFVFRSKIDGRGPEGGTATSQVSSKILLDSGRLSYTLGKLSETTGPITFDINKVSPVPPECERSTISNGTMEVKVLVNLNMETKSTSITKVAIFFDFPTKPTEGIRCSGGGQLLDLPFPFWMPSYEWANISWKSVSGGFFTTLPIVNRGNVFAELEIQKEIPGNDATELSSYKLIHKPGN